MEKSQLKNKTLKKYLSILQNLKKPMLLREKLQPLRLDRYMETQKQCGAGV